MKKPVLKTPHNRIAWQLVLAIIIAIVILVMWTVWWYFEARIKSIK